MSSYSQVQSPRGGNKRYRISNIAEYPSQGQMGDIGQKMLQTTIAPVYPSYSNIAEMSGMNLVGWQYRSLPDPLHLTLDEFLRLPLDAAIELQARVSEQFKNTLDTAWRKGNRQVIICGGQIVYEDMSNNDVPNSLVEKFSKELNKACFVFSAPDMVEDCIWTPINDHDDYPTIELHIGTEEMPDNDVIANGVSLRADFDTGNPYYRVFDANQFSEPISTFSALEMRGGTHLGVDYVYFQKKVKICVADIGGKIHSLVRDIRLVKNWMGSALLQTSPNRKGYIGRDIARDLTIKIELTPGLKTTRILDI